MASLMKPLQRALMQNLRGVNAIRFASSAKPPVDASKDAKIEKKTTTDPLEDPKAACNLTKIFFLNFKISKAEVEYFNFFPL